MPHLFFSGPTDEQPAPPQSPPPAAHDDGVDTDSKCPDKENMWGRTWKQMGNWLKKEDESEMQPPVNGSIGGGGEELSEKVPCQDPAPTRPSHAIIPGMPRPITFKRQDSERRERLYPHEPDHEERRALSADRRLGTSYEQKASPYLLPPLASSAPRSNAPESATGSENVPDIQHDFASTAGTVDEQHSDRHDEDIEVHSHYDWAHHDVLHHPDQLSEALDELQIQSELEAKWILNLSMHFRDHSDREKFFITYAEEPNKWRRVTVSCDYRHAPHDSLEADLKSLHYQRDKSARIYEAIRDSLPQIQFYSTVTNLKLETSDGRLHVHVTEDVNEIIQYPSAATVEHLDLPHFAESAIEFDCHMSGFVYKVQAGTGCCLIKKEIPGPEAVEEFLYEINALSALRSAAHVVRLEGLVVDEEHGTIKGILLNYCDQGALVDLIYDFRHTDTLTWSRRLRWARQIVHGLAEIHEAGFVQGDFTLSNIVIDCDDNARIIDINRRGCPIGWEPPELAQLIQHGQRVAMYIGVKSDVFQLGMVLWALAEQQDEPERQERPLRFRDRGGEAVPEWYREIVGVCLEECPRSRLLAKELLEKFPVKALEEEKERPDVQSNGTAEHTERELKPEISDLRDPSPLAASPPANLETAVEYLVGAPDSDAPLDPPMVTNAHSENKSMHEVIIDAVPRDSSSGDQTTGNLTSIPEEDTPLVSVFTEPPQDAPIPVHAISIPPLAPTETPAVSTSSLLEIPQTIVSSADDVDAVQKETSRLAESPSENLGNPPLATLSPISAIPSPSVQEELYRVDVSPSVDLGNPPLATLSPPPATTPVTTEPLMLDEQRGLDGSPSLGMGNPPLAILSSPPPEVAEPATERRRSRSQSVDIGNPPLATFSPPPASASPSTQDVSLKTDTHPPVDPETVPLQALSSPPALIPSPPNEAPRNNRDSVDIGYPPLATFSPPFATSPQPAQDQIQSFVSSEPIPAESHHREPPRANTLGLELPTHQDSGFDEPASATVTGKTPITSTPVAASPLRSEGSTAPLSENDSQPQDG